MNIVALPPIIQAGHIDVATLRCLKIVVNTDNV